MRSPTVDPKAYTAFNRYQTVNKTIQKASGLSKFNMIKWGSEKVPSDSKQMKERFQDAHAVRWYRQGREGRPSVCKQSRVGRQESYLEHYERICGHLHEAVGAIPDDLATGQRGEEAFPFEADLKHHPNLLNYIHKTHTQKKPCPAQNTLAKRHLSPFILNPQQPLSNINSNHHARIWFKLEQMVQEVNPNLDVQLQKLTRKWRPISRTSKLHQSPNERDVPLIIEKSQTIKTEASEQSTTLNESVALRMKKGNWIET